MKIRINCMLLAFLLGTGISVSAFAQEKPLAADELASRIVDREDAGDFDGALDYVKQLQQTSPNYSYNLVYDLEGGIKLDLNDLDEAMSDYNKAIESDPPFGSYYIHRGYLKQFQGDLPGAMADYNIAIKKDPKDPVAYYNWGCLLLDKGNLDTALAEFETSYELAAEVLHAQNTGADMAGANTVSNVSDFDMTDICALRIWVVKTRLGKTAEADQELASYLDSRWNVTPGDYIGTIGGYLCGQLSDIEFTKAQGSGRLTNGQVCRQWYYYGMKKLLTGDREGAGDSFRSCVNTNKQSYDEYASARTELARMDADKSYGILATPAASKDTWLGPAGMQHSVIRLKVAVLAPLLALLLVWLYSAVCLQRIAKKTNTRPEIFAWVPVLNLILVCRMVKMSAWYLLLLFVPVGNAVMVITLFYKLPGAVGINGAARLLMFVPGVNLVFLGYLAFKAEGQSAPPGKKPEILPVKAVPVPVAPPVTPRQNIPAVEVRAEEKPSGFPPPSPGKSFTEKDNRGTRYEKEDMATSYWITRFTSPKKDPYLLYDFENIHDALAALLELPCIHLAEDSRKLICTKVLHFGYYAAKETGLYETFLCGGDLDPALWKKARESFLKHGGRPHRNGRQGEFGTGELEPALQPVA